FPGRPDCGCAWETCPTVRISALTLWRRHRAALVGLRVHAKMPATRQYRVATRRRQPPCLGQHAVGYRKDWPAPAWSIFARHVRDFRTAAPAPRRVERDH